MCHAIVEPKYRFSLQQDHEFIPVPDEDRLAKLVATLQENPECVRVRVYRLDATFNRLEEWRHDDG
jgi:hypothetical protein